MTFYLKNFEGLAVSELHQLYTLRAKVFVVEQNCAYQDPDDKDPHSLHVLAMVGEKLVAYARLVPPGISYAEPSIGRVVVDNSYRRTGAGIKLMKFCIEQCGDLFNGQDIVISAQLYLLMFYTNLGFVPDGSAYDEDNIPHIKMRYSQTH